VPEVVIVGAGLAGLACALHLSRAGVDVALHEAADAVGGRVRTDVVDGMLLDRGFQVHNTGYPEARRVLSHDALALRPFAAGALLRYGDRLHRVGDPRRTPAWALSTALAPIGSVKDKAAVVALAARAALTPVPRLLDAPETCTYLALRSHGLSDTVIDRFVRPFLTGVFLEDELATSSRFFDVVWRSFARGTQCVPTTGMQAIPAQLASRLPTGVLRLSSPVEVLPKARAVVVATDPVTAGRLAGTDVPAMNGVTTHYHLADEPPTAERAIVLDGERSGPVANSVVLTNVAPSYAPGRVLVSSSVVSGPATEPEVRAHLSRVYGVDTSRWEQVTAVEVPQGLPSMAPPLGRLRKDVRVREGVWVCGDHRDSASIQGALVSGRRAATSVLKELRP
jgi:phytoene dehydrogenase-like protein